mgnify:CR=1 FL=1
MCMAKKIVEVDEDLLKGMMTSDIPLYGRDTERKETEPAPKKAATAEPENISDAPAERTCRTGEKNWLPALHGIQKRPIFVV